jgi:alpha-galactosidase
MTMRRLLSGLTAATVLLGLAVAVTTLQVGRPQPAYALDNGLALTPPMGFNNWNATHCRAEFNEAMVKGIADIFVASGLQDAGYQYVNIDDCWALPERDADGNLVPDPVRFPNGIKAVADYVHAKGLKFGIYTSAGTKTCNVAGFPGALGHEQQDANLFASWGVDYLKYDNCNNQGVDAKLRYTAMRDALAATGRPIVYSICEWGQNQPWTWAQDVGNLWRTTGDISDNWGSVRNIVRQNMSLYPYAKPGAWNDPDMLEVGNGGMTSTEYRSHLSVWAMMAAPLLIGSDLRLATPATLDTLLNREVIAVDQDPLGVQAKPIRNDSGRIVFVRPLANGDTAVALYNETDTGAVIRTTAAEAGLGRTPAYTLRDVWRHETTETAGVISAYVPAHGTVMYRVAASTNWADYAPATDLSVTVPPAYPGATLSVVQPGTANPLSTTFTNHGRTPTTQVATSLSAPAGWTVQATSPATDNRVGTEEAFTTQWTVTPPADAPAGSYPLTARTTFTWNDDEQPRSGAVESAATVLVPRPPPSGTQWLSDVPWLFATSFWGPIELDRSNGERGAHDGHTITIGGVTYAKGIGAHAPSEIVYYTGGRCATVSSDYGIDDEKSGNGDATWQIWADGVLAAQGSATWQDGPKHLDADVTGASFVRLVTLDNGSTNSDHTDWAGAQIVCAQ